MDNDQLRQKFLEEIAKSEQVILGEQLQRENKAKGEAAQK